MREKVGKSRNTVFFQWFGAPEGRKVGSLKRRVRSQLARWEMKSCTPLWREADFQVKMYKTHQLRTTFGSSDVKKAHAVVARSTFPSQNVQNTPASDHFWKLRCRKPLWREAHFQVKMYKTHQLRTTFGSWDVENRCGAKHISKSKCTKHTILGPLLEVQMSKKCTPLWREAHFQVKMYKAPHVRATFGGSNVASPLRFTTLHYVTLHYTPLYYTTLHYTTPHNTTTTTTQLDYTPLHSTALNFTTLHYTTLRSTTLHYIKLHYNTLNDTAPQIDR